MTKNISKNKEIQEFKDKLKAQKQADLSEYQNDPNRIQEKLTQENRQKLTWNANQVSEFLKNTPPDMTGLCKGSGWTFPQGETSLLIAQGGTGKSYLLLELMLAFAAGIEYGEFKPKKKFKVLGLFGEDCQTILHTRIRNIIKSLDLKNHLVDLDKNFNAKSVINMRLVEFGEHQNPSFTENYNSLRKALAEEKEKGEPIEVLILDPLIRFYGLNENDNQQAAFFVDTVIGSLQKEFGLTVILAHHVPKATSKGFTTLNISDIDQISPRGASAFLDNCRYALAMMKVSKKEAKTYGIREEDYKNYVAIKPIKNNYTGEIASPSFLRRFDYGVLLPSNPGKDLNTNIESELYSCLYDYYNGDEITCTTETTRGKIKTDSEPLPPITERKKLSIRDLSKNDNKDPKIRRIVDLIHARLRKIGLKRIQEEIGLRVVALAERKRLKIENAKNTNKQEISLT